MDKALFLKLAEELKQKYLAYSEGEKGESKILFSGLAGLAEKEIICYTDADWKAAADKFLDEHWRLGTHASYSLADFLQDPNTQKTQYTSTLDFVYEILNNNKTDTSYDLSPRIFSSLIDICLHYVWATTEGGPRGPNHEIVLDQNDTTNIKLFCKVINLYKSEYAQIILAKTVELLDLQIPHDSSMSFAIKFRNYFVGSPNNVLFNKNVEIQNSVTSERLELLLGNGTDGDRKANGVLGYIENDKQTPFLEVQGALYRYMDTLLFNA